jgi:hypothetical protein
MALSIARRLRLTVTLPACLAVVVLLVLATGSTVAEGSQGGAEAQGSSPVKPVAALLGSVTATVDEVAGQEVLPAPSAPDSTPAPSPVEAVVSAATGQSAAPNTETLLRDASADTTGNAPGGSRVVVTVHQLTEPVRQVTAGTLHRTAQSVGGVVTQVPVVGRSARHVVGGVSTVARGLLAKTPLSPVASRTPVQGLLALATGGEALPGEAGERSLASSSGASGLFANSALVAATFSPGDAVGCVACGAGAPVGVPGPTAAAVSRPGVVATVTRPVASTSPSPAAASTSSSSSPFRAPSTPRSPGPGGVVSSAGGAAACAGLALALLWLFATVLPGVKRRLGEDPQIRLIAPFELILQRPG